MANFYPNTVETIVSDATRPTSKAGFSIPLFFAPLASDKPVSFTSVKGVIEAGFAVNSPVERFAANAFAGEFAPNIVKVFPLALSTIVITVDPAIAANDTVKINVSTQAEAKTVEQVFTTDVAATVTALKTKLDAATGVAFTASANTLTYTYAKGDAAFSVGFDSFTSIAHNTTTKPATAYADALSYDDNFFFTASTLHDAVSVTEFALCAAAEKKIHIYSSSDIKNGQPAEAGSIAEQLANKTIDHVLGFWSEEAESQYPEGSVIGYTANIEPQRKNTLNMATLVGITPSKLTVEFKQTLAKRNMSYYVKEQGVGVLHEGWVASGKFFDLVRFKCWSAARTTEAIFNHLKRASDIGSAVIFNQADFDALSLSIKSEMINPAISGQTVLNEMSINTTTGKKIDLRPKISFPSRADIPTSSLADRVLDNVFVELVYGNPIHHVKININVVLNRQ